MVQGVLNPCRGAVVGLISKHIIKKIIRKIQEKQRHNLWVNSEDTIEWFKKIKNKTNSTFIQFDIVDFYPSITEDILKKSIHHAKTYTNITDEEIEIITTCRKSILYSNNHAWIKNSQNNFDVPMGAYDSAQIADLVDIYIIDTLGTIIDKEQIGIYKDDGLIHITNSNGPKTSKVQKQIIKKFKEIGFKIEIQANLKITNYLDITLNLNNNTYKPYSKDDQPCGTTTSRYRVGRRFRDYHMFPTGCSPIPFVPTLFKIHEMWNGYSSVEEESKVAQHSKK